MLINGPGVVNFYSSMDSVWSLCYIGPRMSHVMVYCTGWILDRAHRTKETMSDFVKLWILENGTQWCSIELYDIHRLSES